MAGSLLISSYAQSSFFSLLLSKSLFIFHLKGNFHDKFVLNSQIRNKLHFFWILWKNFYKTYLIYLQISSYLYFAKIQEEIIYIQAFGMLLLKKLMVTK